MEQDYKLFIVVGLLFIAAIGFVILIIASMAKIINDNPLRIVLFGEKRSVFLEDSIRLGWVLLLWSCAVFLLLSRLIW